MLSALGARLETCRQTPTASSLMRYASGIPSHPFTAAQTLQLPPIAYRWIARLYFLSTSLSMANNTMHLGQLVGTSHRLSGSSSLARIWSLPMEKSSKSSSAVKISDNQTVRCGWRRCAGSRHGTESAIVSGINCESPFPNKLLHPDHSPVSSRSVNVQLWALGEYQNHAASLPSLIDPCWINSQLALTTVSIGQNRTKVWATIDLAKVCNSNMVGDVHTSTYIIYHTVMMVTQDEAILG
jgi:hypothetical protein